MHTPRLAKSVMYHRKGQLRCRYGRLVDGVHPNHNLQLEWVDTLDRVLDLKRSSPNQLPPPEPVKSQPDDEEYDSDSFTKRSWLYWWRWLCVSGWTVLSWHPTSVSASWPLSPESGCWCLGQTLRMAPQSLTVNGWDWLNTLATLWCRGRLVKAALLVGVLGSMSRAECAACVSCERQSSVDINKSYIVIKRLAMFRCHMKCKLFYLKCTGLVPLVVD